MLIFAANVADPTPGCRPSGNTIDGVEPFLVRPAKIINQCLPEVIAIRKWLSGDSGHSCVDRFDASAKLSVATLSFEFVTKFRFEEAINLLPLPDQKPPARGERTHCESRASSL